MSPARRKEPLRAERLPIEPMEPPTASGPDTNGHQVAGRFQRLADGVRDLRVGGGSLNFSERTLMVLGGIIAPLGLVLVLLGWYGAAHTPYLVEQMPYVVSGGLLGLGLVFLGSFFYFAHWMTELVKEHRQQSAAVVDAIGRLEEVIRDTARPAGGVGEGAVAPDGVILVATNKGTMAHRRDCVVVNGKADIRTVTPADGLLPCKLCDPYAESLNTL